jgi:hypothetical protein
VQWWLPALQSLSAAARSGHAVKLETRAVGLSIAEGNLWLIFSHSTDEKIVGLAFCWYNRFLLHFVPDRLVGGGLEYLTDFSFVSCTPSVLEFLYSEEKRF